MSEKKKDKSPRSANDDVLWLFPATLQQLNCILCRYIVLVKRAKTLFTRLRKSVEKSNQNLDLKARQGKARQGEGYHNESLKLLNGIKMSAGMSYNVFINFA